tara:strand:+ start:25497 stop:26444 length:948 start_codon:yes stop_codon:yes gene_type:complete
MKSVVVYNTCGIKRDNTAWYIECIKSFLNQDFDDYRVVLSSCLNSAECLQEIYKTFRNEISYSFHSEPHTVNITFNKALQDFTSHFGDAETYVYVDSGCTFDDQRDILSRLYETYKSGPNGIIALQCDTDEALQVLDPKFKYQTSDVQIKDEDYIIPIGKSINQHVHLFSNEIYKAYNNKIEPDVFAAYCSESTFNFLAAAVNQRWVIMKDIQIRHLKGVDGASNCKPHWSSVHRNPWNNLLCGRDANDFINDPEARRVGMGYEECNDIMNHNPDAYGPDGFPLFPEELKSMINKYFFLSKEELDYDKMKCKFIP